MSIQGNTLCRALVIRCQDAIPIWVVQDSGLDGIVFARNGHQSASPGFLTLGSLFTAASKSFSTGEGCSS